jgi:Uma2 family endonuclease
MTILPGFSTSQPAVLDGIDWDTYRRLIRVLHKRRRFRLTYDRGRVQITSPLWEHEAPAALLGRFIESLTLLLGLPLRAGGSVTLKRRRFQRGLEPDKCYWIASADRLQERTQLDLRIDPPPDLAIEVDITTSSIPRLPIYARLGVAEVWRLDRRDLRCHVLEAGSYQERSHSLAFPTLRVADLEPFLAQLGQVDDNTLVRQFQVWYQQQRSP